MRASLLILTMTALAFLFYGCPKVEKPVEAPPRQDPCDTMRSVRVEDRGFTISVPASWEIKQAEANPALYAYQPGASNYGPMINVVTEQLNQRMGPYDYLQANLLTMRISIPELEIIKGGMEVTGGVSTAWILYAYPRGNVKVKALSYCQTKEYKAYVVTGLAPATDFADYLPCFRQIGLSLRVD